MRIRSSLLVLSCSAVLGLASCGGGGDGGNGATPPPVAVSSPASLTMTDSVIGTGAAATSGRKLTVRYSGWLYSDSAPEHKGTHFESGTFSFVLGQSAVIAGWEQGVSGMKAGGKRSLSIPASLAYGSKGSGPIPPNSGLQFDVELLAVE